MATTSTQCRISSNGRWVSVRSEYSGSFVAEARSAGGTWDRNTRVWLFDTHSGVTLDLVKQICRRHYGDVVFVDGAALTPITAPPTPDAGFVGAVGATITVLVQVTKIVDLDGQYGTTRLTIMRDSANHVLVWRAANERLDVGERVTLTGKIKKHEPYRGVSQTVLTRCKVIQKHAGLVSVPAEPEAVEAVAVEDSGEFEAIEARLTALTTQIADLESTLTLLNARTPCTCTDDDACLHTVIKFVRKQLTELKAQLPAEQSTPAVEPCDDPSMSLADEVGF